MAINIKKDEDKIQTILDFYITTNKLKDLVRSGWKSLGIKRERVESVAEHIYGVCMLAISIWSETLPEVNLSEVIMMIALHEVEEIVIGDITPFDGADSLQKKRKGEEAVQKIFKNLIAKDVYFKLVHDFNTMATPEAVFASKCDKLECDIQARLYSDEGALKIENVGKIKDNILLKELKQKGPLDVADYFIVHDREKHFKDDDIFLKINKHIQGKKIIKKVNGNE